MATKSSDLLILSGFAYSPKSPTLVLPVGIVEPATWNGLDEIGSGECRPELAPIIQEIVSRLSWAQGHALAVIITEPAGSMLAASVAMTLLHHDAADRAVQMTLFGEVMLVGSVAKKSENDKNQNARQNLAFFNPFYDKRLKVDISIMSWNFERDHLWNSTTTLF